MRDERLDPLSLWSLASFVALALLTGLFMFVSSRAGVRGSGVLLLFYAATHLLQRRIPYGWSERNPLGHVKGKLAVAVGLFTAAVGIFMILQPDLMLALFP